MRCHPNCLQRRRTVAVDGHTRHIVEAGLNSHMASHIETLLARWRTSAQHQVFDLVPRELGHAVEGSVDDLGSDVISPLIFHRAFESSADRATSG